MILYRLSFKITALYKKFNFLFLIVQLKTRCFSPHLQSVEKGCQNHNKKKTEASLIFFFLIGYHFPLFDGKLIKLIGLQRQISESSQFEFKASSFDKLQTKLLVAEQELQAEY